MTYSKARLHSGPVGKPRSLLQSMSLGVYELRVRLGVDGSQHWPDPRYRDDPILFAREVLGIEPWGDDEHGQIGMLRYVQRYRRSAFRAGRKVSKSCSIGVLALWWFAIYPDAQVVMSSVTARQVDEILWDEVRRLHDRSQRELDPQDPAIGWARENGHEVSTRPLDGEPRVLARSGLVSGFRRVAGFTAREGVAAQGKSGVHLLYLLDESSGIPQAIIDAVIGNMAASGCKLALFGNPTSSEGEFHDAFDKKAFHPETNPTGYHTLTISSEESPNVLLGREVVPGLASREWLQERVLEWGRDSSLFKVHVLGQHVEIEAGKIVSLAQIREAEDRWCATVHDSECKQCGGTGEIGHEKCLCSRLAVPAEGVLHVGVDPAFAVSGDEAAFCVRRGKRVIEVRAFRGLIDELAHVAMLDSILKAHRLPGEVAAVVLDALGDVGAKVKTAFSVYQAEHAKDMILVALRGSDNAIRKPDGYVRVRDELWGCVEEWLRDGGAIPEDARLEKDLHSPSWLTYDLKQRKIATKKDDLRKILGRSPDRGDALALACWESGNAVKWALEEVAPQKPAWEPAAMGLDPYQGAETWK